MKVTNNGQGRMSFKVEKGTKSFLEPGETADLKIVNPESATMKSREHVGLIKVERSKAPVNKVETPVKKD